jgi:hypothetical protein
LYKDQVKRKPGATTPQLQHPSFSFFQRCARAGRFEGTPEYTVVCRPEHGVFLVPALLLPSVRATRRLGLLPVVR